MVQRERLDHFIETALRSHRTLVRMPWEGWRCLPSFRFKQMATDPFFISQSLFQLAFDCGTE